MIKPRNILSSRFLLLLVFLPFCSISLALEAAPSDQDDTTYRAFVKRASGGDLAIDFREFRLACLKAGGCDPQGESKDLISMRQAIQAKQYGSAVKTAEALIEQGFVNIEAHAICSQAYAALNNPEKAKFHHAIAASLIRSIVATGDGKSKETAFEVIGTFEEHLIMAVLGLPGFASQSVIPGKPHSYDILEVDDPKTGKKVSVFFNIDLFYPPKGL